MHTYIIAKILLSIYVRTYVFGYIASWSGNCLFLLAMYTRAETNIQMILHTCLVM